ncbi:hypothetical protein Ocin01_09066 [Orchesella cincta]|uniref:Uncharacterized protein n=1 Tax=Orchesella cincta TaxID=48709 RepID=A0A1D2MY90_ORCCI|nr:hypothetical protein Ocin01_09066 [Orchesella cincta]
MEITTHIFVVLCVIIVAVSASSLPLLSDPETTTVNYHHDSQSHNQNQSQVPFSDQQDHYGKNSGYEYHDQLKEPQWSDHEITNRNHTPEDIDMQKDNENQTTNSWGETRHKRHFHIDLPFLDYGHEHGHHHHGGYDEHYHHDPHHHHHHNGGGHWHWHEG